MNNKITDSTVVWHQTIGTDSTPVLDKTHGLVYCSSPCPIYSNTDLGEVEHNYVDGFCTGCGKDQNEPMLVNGWYEITNAGEFYWFANKVNLGNTSYKGKLMADIVVNDSVLSADGTLNGPDSIYTSWTPIGTYNNKFGGTFDGQGHTISGLYFNSTINSNYPNGGNYIGLFGYMYNSSATIKNVGVVDSYFYGYYYVGGICGYQNNGKIINCYSASTVYAGNSGGDSNAGGICGGMDNSSVIENCFNTGYISVANRCVGGICGGQWNGRISMCYNTGAVYANSSNSTSNTAYVGGISGYMSNSATMDNCYNTGDVEGKGYRAGGITGNMNSGNKLTSCFNIGNVKAGSSFGGITGYFTCL